MGIFRKRKVLVMTSLLASASGYSLRSAVNEALSGDAPVQVEVGVASGMATLLSAEEQEAAVGTFLKMENAAHEKLILVDDSELVFGKDPNDPTLTNWADNNKAFGLRKHHPKTYDEVAALVRQKRAEGAKLRPMGMVHSWSNLLPEDNTDVVFLDNFKLITQSSNDYSIVTVQAGVLQSELADWADSPARGVGRFSYLYQNTLVQPISFVGACQTASHGSGFLPPTPDYIIAMTIVDGNGEVKYFDRSHPDLKVMAACLGMCGIVLDVTVRFNPDTSATKVTQTKMQYQDLFPPRGVPITENYNPLKTFIESHAGGAINYSPYNSALLHSGKLDVNKVEEYHQSDGVWTHAVDTLPGTSVCLVRTGLPIWGTQHEPFYDKDLFVPEDWMMNVPGSRVHRSFMGDWRLNTKWANYSPFMGKVVNNQVLFMNPPSFSYRTQVTYNTSNAGSTHFLRYIDGITSGLDFEFAFKVDDDFGNIYEAWRVMIEESENMWREKDMIPLNIFCAIRWVGASSCPLSHAYGEPGERFAMLEPTSSHGTTGWEEYLGRVMARWTQIRSKDGSLPKPHWAKWDKEWTPQIIPYIKEVYGPQMDLIRPVVMRLDPAGIFRTEILCDLFGVPCLPCHK